MGADRVKKSEPKTKSKRGGQRFGAGRKPGTLNRSTAEIKELLRANIDLDKFAQSLGRRAMRGNMKAAKLVLEYIYGKPPQQLQITGDLSKEYFDALRAIADKVMGEKV